MALSKEEFGTLFFDNEYSYCHNIYGNPPYKCKFCQYCFRASEREQHTLECTEYQTRLSAKYTAYQHFIAPFLSLVDKITTLVEMSVEQKAINTQRPE